MSWFERCVPVWVSLWLPLAALAAGPGGEAGDPDVPLGQHVYESYCASCHGQKVARAPDPHMLKLLTADSVLKALNDGVMVAQAEPLHADERAAVAEYLTGKALGQENTDPGLAARLFTAGLYGLMAQWHLAPGSFSWDDAAAALAGSLAAVPQAALPVPDGDNRP